MRARRKEREGACLREVFGDDEEPASTSIAPCLAIDSDGPKMMFEKLLRFISISLRDQSPISTEESQSNHKYKTTTQR